MASMTRRLLEAYAADEPWKVDHDGVKRCWEVEDGLSMGLDLYRWLSKRESKLQALAIAGELAADDPCWGELDAFRRVLLAGSRRWMERAERMEAAGYPVEGIEDFRLAVEEATAIIECAEFAETLPPAEELFRLARPENPRPDRYGV